MVRLYSGVQRRGERAEEVDRVRWVGGWADGGVCVCVDVGGGGRYVVHVTRWLLSHVLSHIQSFEQQRLGI